MSFKNLGKFLLYASVYSTFRIIAIYNVVCIVMSTSVPGFLLTKCTGRSSSQKHRDSDQYCCVMTHDVSVFRYGYACHSIISLRSLSVVVSANTVLSLDSLCVCLRVFKLV